MNSELQVITGADVLEALRGREADLLELVRQAYMAHGRGESSLPHSVFLRFPSDDKNRIIGLPAYLGGDFRIAGMKWIASFPGNIERGLERASAAILLNSTENGRPVALLEGSIISAKRTAASAALAAQVLRNGQDTSRIGIVGCGLINFEIIRFLQAACGNVEHISVFDQEAERAAQFLNNVMERLHVDGELVSSLPEVLRSAPLISFATSAGVPHVSDLSELVGGSTVLHISLRDLSPEVILSCDNVVDDADHVCRANTSVHLAEQQVGHRDFIRCSLAEILEGRQEVRPDPKSITVFSPFGLGVLDLAVSQFALEAARRSGGCTMIPSFVPESWLERA